MQLDPLVAARDQLLGEAAVVLRRRQPAFELVTAHDRAIGRHLVAIGADQLVDRHAEAAAGQIPERAVDDRQRPVGQLRRAAALPVRQVLPEPLAVERIGADQHLAHELLDDMRPNDLGRREGIALDAGVGADGQQSHLDLVRRTRMRMAGGVRVPSRRCPEHPDRHVLDLHAGSPLRLCVIPCCLPYCMMTYNKRSATSRRRRKTGGPGSSPGPWRSGCATPAQRRRCRVWIGRAGGLREAARISEREGARGRSLGSFSRRLALQMRPLPPGRPFRARRSRAGRAQAAGCRRSRGGCGRGA